jgi:hypothetical protein
MLYTGTQAANWAGKQIKTIYKIFDDQFCWKRAWYEIGANYYIAIASFGFVTPRYQQFAFSQMNFHKIMLKIQKKKL